MIKNVYWSSFTVVVIFMKLEFFSTDFRKILKKSNFIKIRPVGTKLFHADRRTDRHDDANSRFSQFCESA